MRIVKGLEEAIRVLCTNRTQSLEHVPPHALDRTEKALGKRLTPVKAVELILDEVKRRGDDAVRELTRRLDGHDLQDFEVTRKTISAAYKQVPRDDSSYHAAELGRAEALRSDGKPDAAVEVLEQLAQTNGNQISVQSALGDMMRQLERYDPAADRWETLTPELPFSPRHARAGSRSRDSCLAGSFCSSLRGLGCYERVFHFCPRTYSGPRPRAD